MIKLNNITKHYGDKKLFTDFQLTIDPKEKVLITAPSGSGKTTLIRLIMGFEIPECGSVTIDGQTLDKDTIPSIREKIAYVSQDTDLGLGTVRQQLNLIFNFKVNRHLTSYTQNFQAICPDFHLTGDIIDEDVSKLSGGERQRVALIIALLLGRPIMILDEITSGLDSHLKHHIADKLNQLDKTVVIISHDDIWQGYPAIREVSL